MDEWIPVRFIDAEIDVVFSRPPLLSKKPDPPAAFVWEGRERRIRELVGQWFDFERRGRMAKNMQPAHLRTAARRGSWGVGRYYFRVVTEDGIAFDLYYDRAPEDAGDRAGHWVLWRELRPA
ncbi:MAG TPA: DUF6504 family protein [Anaerolineales bacterium]|nr:DUF6504 family protein [Anaerolineales bacterium]